MKERQGMLTPADLDLPAKFKEFRPGQLQLSAKIATSAKYAYLLDAPTGVGKSLIAATTQRLFGSYLTYVCVTKQLQDQILADFPYARTIKGRNNYICLKYPRMYPTVSADECTHTEDNPCPHINRCPYLVAKEEALHAPLAVLNTAYFLSEANYAGQFKGRKFLVLDEFDTIEDQLMSFIELRITKKQLDRHSLSVPRYKTKFESWVEWARVAAASLRPRLDQLERDAAAADWGGVDWRVLRERKQVERLLAKLNYFVREVDVTWVWYPGEDNWAFKPVWVSKYANPVLWDHTDRVLGMSATILDPRQMSANTGLVSKVGRTYDYIQMPSPFPKENRPVYYEPAANVINKEMDVALPRLAAAVQRILDRHPNDKILLHTVSYKVRDFLQRNVSTGRFLSHTTADRAQVLEVFKKSPDPLVLVSPSMDRGVDLPYDECRVVIIAKVPYPDLGDPQVNKRVHASKDGSHWYAHRTVSSIVQMAGRGVRAMDDFAATYILDSQFERLYNQYRTLFPGWFAEAIIH